MSEFVKKTALGGYKQVSGGQSDPECTHVIMTLKAYEQLLSAKKDAETGRDNALLHVERELQEAKNEADARVRKVEQRANREIDKIRADLTKAQEEAEYQADLNKNLLRISKERANADRGLRPKKEHTGYFVVSSTEKEYRYKVHGQRNMESAVLWETVMQSPYTVDFTEEQAKKLIEKDLTPEGEKWLVVEIGITGSYPGKYEDLLRKTKPDDEFLQRNVMLSRTLKANFRTGYWETSFLHTYPLGVVPANMRAK